MIITIPSRIAPQITGMDALSICSEVDAGRMKTYTLAEVSEHLNELES